VGSEIQASDDLAERGWITFPHNIAEVRSVRHPGGVPEGFGDADGDREGSPG
jgi:hypothetical protein